MDRGAWQAAVHAVAKSGTRQSNAHSQCVCVCVLVAHSCLFVTPWTVADQPPLSMGFSRQEHWSGLPYASPHSHYTYICIHIDIYMHVYTHVHVLVCCSVNQLIELDT